jgi:hypothetical protein
MAKTVFSFFKTVETVLGWDVVDIAHGLNRGLCFLCDSFGVVGLYSGGLI